MKWYPITYKQVWRIWINSVCLLHKFLMSGQEIQHWTNKDKVEEKQINNCLFCGYLSTYWRIRARCSIVASSQFWFVCTGCKKCFSTKGNVYLGIPQSVCICIPSRTRDHCLLGKLYFIPLWFSVFYITPYDFKNYT